MQYYTITEEYAEECTDSQVYKLSVLTIGIVTSSTMVTPQYKNKENHQVTTEYEEKSISHKNCSLYFSIVCSNQTGKLNKKFQISIHIFFEK